MGENLEGQIIKQGTHLDGGQIIEGNNTTSLLEEKLELLRKNSNSLVGTTLTAEMNLRGMLSPLTFVVTITSGSIRYDDYFRNYLTSDVDQTNIHYFDLRGWSTDIEGSSSLSGEQLLL